MTTKVASVDILCVEIATVVRIPKGVTGASLAIRNMNLAFLGERRPKCFHKLLLITLTLDLPSTRTFVSSWFPNFRCMTATSGLSVVALTSITSGSVLLLVRAASCM